MDIKSVVPSQLIAERGSDVVVINLGSANLRMGIATKQLPVVVPHCIAHHVLVPEESMGHEVLRKKGSVAEQGWATHSSAGLRRTEREELCQMVELQLKMKPFYPEQEGTAKVGERVWTNLELDHEESFQWTQVMVEEVAAEDGSGLTIVNIRNSVVEDNHSSASLSSVRKPQHETHEEIQLYSRENAKAETREKLETKTPEETEKMTIEKTEREDHGEFAQRYGVKSEEEVADGSDSEIHVEVSLPREESPNLEGNSNDQPVKKKLKYRRYICGEEAQKIPASEPYFLRWPISRGHLNISQQYSLQQVLDDIHLIWDWMLTEELSLDPGSRHHYSAVLVVPDTLDNREIKELISVVLRDLQFRSAVVHQECVAATFGNGISSACVVNMGAQVTSVVCIEDGVALPSTRIVLPFGGEDISRCLLWVQQRWQTWPPVDTDPLQDPLDLQMMEHIKEEHCLIVEGEQHAMVDIHCRQLGMPTQAYKASLKALSVPVMGLFYPSLLAPEEYATPLRPWHHIDHEDVLDDSFHVESGRRNDASEVGIPPGSNGGAVSIPGNSEMPVVNDNRGARAGTDEPYLGLSQAIVISILSTGRPDIQKKLFASIQLVGGVAYTRGLVDAVEERVLHAIPAHEAVDTVAVLQNRTEASITCWKGGAVLGILDFYRDSWVQAEDWVAGGVRIGSGRKYKDSLTLHSQAFWYGSTLE